VGTNISLLIYKGVEDGHVSFGNSTKVPIKAEEKYFFPKRMENQVL